MTLSLTVLASVVLGLAPEPINTTQRPLAVEVVTRIDTRIDTRMDTKRAAVFGAAARSPHGRSAIAQVRRIKLLQYMAVVPAGWTSREPSSSMRLAEFTTSASAGAGAPGAEIVVYYFGAGQGGPVDANLARWKSQFSNPSGGAVYEKITKDPSGAYPLTIAEYRGSYARGTGMGSAPDKALPDHVLLAAVAETEQGTMFFQLYGPASAVEAQRATYLAFVRSLK